MFFTLLLLDIQFNFKAKLFRIYFPLVFFANSCFGPKEVIRCVFSRDVVIGLFDQRICKLKAVCI